MNDTETENIQVGLEVNSIRYHVMNPLCNECHSLLVHEKSSDRPSLKEQKITPLQIPHLKYRTRGSILSESPGNLRKPFLFTSDSFINNLQKTQGRGSQWYNLSIGKDSSIWHVTSSPQSIDVFSTTTGTLSRDLLSLTYDTSRTLFP